MFAVDRLHLIDALPELITSIIDFVIGAIPTLIEAGLTLFIALVGALPEIITGVVAAIPQIIESLLSAVLGSIPLLISAGIDLFLSLIEALPVIIPQIVQAMPQIIIGIVGAIIKSIPQMIDAGVQIVRGLWDGISRMGGWLWSQVTGFVNTLVNNVKNLLGIASPSKVFAWIGKNLGLGMVMGIENSTRDVQAAMNAMVAIPSMSAMRLSVEPVAGVQYTGAGSWGSSGGDKVTIKQDFHLYSPTSADPLESTKEAAGLMRTGLALAGVS
jgi:phage-related protein